MSESVFDTKQGHWSNQGLWLRVCIVRRLLAITNLIPHGCSQCLKPRSDTISTL